jgi:phage terminase large subunit
MTILEEFEPLFNSEKYYFITDLWGGRAGARSFHLTAHALHELLYNEKFRGFFIREIHSTIYSSLWQDFKDRFEEYETIHGEHPHIQISDNKNGENYAKNTITGATIVTKGFKAGSKTQTANLKSLAGATHLYIEEAEETEYLAFNKVRLSLRKKGVQIKIVRAFNPPYKEHWIWKDYDFVKVEKHELISLILSISSDTREQIEALVNLPDNHVELLKAVPKNDYHLSINTNYGNNYYNLNAQAINDMEAMKYSDFQLYCVTILGLISSGSERSVYKNWQRITLSEFEQLHGNQLYALDFGDRVPNALLELKFDGEWLYINEMLYVPGNQEPILDAFKRIGVRKDIVIVADSASPNEITKIRAAGYLIRAVSKGHDANVSALKAIRESKVKYVGHNLHDEYIGYKYEENKTGELLKDEVPKKGNDHLMDGIKYGKIGERYAVGMSTK